MINVTALIVFCAILLLVCMFLILYIARLLHWLRYWRKSYIDAVSPIQPIPDNLYDEYDEV